jgi:glycosyltransferase involved in cell wall biosynthesis
MKEKRILFVSSSFLHIGGVGYQINALTHDLSKTYDIYLASTVSNEFLKKYTETDGIFIKWVVKSKFDLNAIYAFNKIIDSVKPDIVHIHEPRARWLLGPLLMLKKIPVIYTTHLPPYFYRWKDRFSGFRQFIYSQIERLFNSFFTSAIIYVSENAFNNALKNRYVSAQKAHLILNGIDLDPYESIPAAEAQQLRRRENVDPATPIICSVARLSAEKNLPFLLKAIYELKKEGYNFVVWLIGAGSEQRVLSNLVKELELEAIVKFWGFQTMIPLLLSASDVFVLTSIYEGGRTIAVMEAQAAGKPCVLSDVADHSTLVNNGECGYIFESGDQAEFVRKIKLLLNSAESRNQFGEAARKKAFMLYDIHTAADKHRQLYQFSLKQMGKLV